MLDLKKLNYEELGRRLVDCYYSCNKTESKRVLDEMATRPEYYKEETWERAY